jgi:thymidylate synthase (methanogen type)
MVVDHTMDVSSQTTMEAWIATLKTILEKGENFDDSDGRVCREVLNLSVTIEHPDVAPDEPIDHIKKINKWFYPSKEELSNIIFNQFDLPLYEYTYGSRLFSHQGVLDQITNYLIPLLRQNPYSRRGTVIVIDPSHDMKIRSRNMPGLVSIHAKVDKGKLRFTAIIRSNDMFIGWPANIYQLVSLQRYVAQELQLGVGAITTYSISAHVFLDYEEEIQRIMN